MLTTLLSSVRRWLPAWLIAAGVLVFSSDFLFFNKVFLPLDLLYTYSPWKDLGLLTVSPQNVMLSDVIGAGLPYLRYLSAELGKGHIPFWLPDIFLGLPAGMFMMTNVSLNPLFLGALWLFPPETAQGAVIVVDLSLIAAFSFLFFKKRGLSDPAAVVGSLVFTFNGVLMVWMEFMAADFAYAGTAVSLYLFERSLGEARYRFMLLNGLVIGVLLLGGSAQWVFFLVPLLGLYALEKTSESWVVRSAPSVNLAPLWLYIGALAIGILIALPSLWHFAEYMPLSHRVHESFAAVNARTGTFYPEMLVTFLFPNFFGYQPTGVAFHLARMSQPVVYQNYIEMMVYMGVVPVVIAGFAFRLRSNRHLAFWALLIVGLAIAVAMKPPTVYRLLYEYVPGFSGMQPSRIFILLPPAFACLAALGIEGLIERRLGPIECQRVALGLVSGVAATAAALVIVHVYLVRHPIRVGVLSLADHFSPSNPDFIFPLSLLLSLAAGFFLHGRNIVNGRALAWGFVGLIMIDLIPFGLRFNPRLDRSLLYPRTSSIEFLSYHQEAFRILPAKVPYNTLMAYGIQTIGGYASMFPASYLALLTAMEFDSNPTAKLGGNHQNYIAPGGVSSKLLPMLNAKYVVLPRDIALAQGFGADYVEVHRSDLAVLEAKRYLPRAYMVYEYRQVHNWQDTIDTMLRNEFDPFRMAVGEKPVKHLESARTNPTNLPAEVFTTRPTSDRFEITVRTDRPGVLVVSEQFFPGWEAWVDDERAEILPVNAALMGIELPPGDHSVVLRFFPRSMKWGLVSTGVTVLGVLLGLTLGGRQSTRNRRSGPHFGVA